LFDALAIHIRVGIQALFTSAE